MVKNKISNSIIHQIIFLAIIITLFLLIISQLSVFLPSLLGAITLYVISRNFFLFLTEKKKWNKIIVILLIFIMAFIAIAIPVYLLVEMAYSRVQVAITYSQTINDSLVRLLHILKSKYNFNLLSKDNITQLTDLGSKYIPQILNGTVNFITVFLFSFFIFYFMLMNARKMESTLIERLPLKRSNTKTLGIKIKSLIEANAVGIPVVALAQGITGLIGYAIIGLDDLWFWFGLTTFTAMIPIVGSALAYIPITILLYTSGQSWQALFILLYGILIIGSIDNICRFTLLKKIGNVHPLITVFGVIFGLSIFGFLGLIFGPLLISLFFLLLKVYNDEFNDKTT